MRLSSEPGLVATSVAKNGHPTDQLPFDPIVRDPRFVRLAEQWDALIERHLPRPEPQDAFYRYNRAIDDSDPPQGWKLHVSATLPSAPRVLAAVAPMLREAGVRFKALQSLLTLKRVNCGSYFGHCQIGKAIAVFARDESEALVLADALARATAGMQGPRVPSDLPYSPDGVVFYRYGAFRPLRPGSQRCDAIRRPDGELVPDHREEGRSVPDWASNPFAPVPAPAPPPGFVLLQPISQRGKGSVHHALDTRETTPRLVVVKQGVRLGELDLDGRDGYSRLDDELHALDVLGASGVLVPQVLDRLRMPDRLYAVLDFIDGPTLQETLMTAPQPLDLMCAVGLCLQAARVVARLHHAGWAWRDCKPQNLIVSTGGVLRAIDFEEACRLDDCSRTPAGTCAYLPPEWPHLERHTDQDLYALGVTMHQILSSSLSYSITAPVKFYRDDVPDQIERLVEGLMSPNRHARPAANDVVLSLERWRTAA